jgi:hypothetical protein
MIERWHPSNAPRVSVDVRCAPSAGRNAGKPSSVSVPPTSLGQATTHDRLHAVRLTHSACTDSYHHLTGEGPPQWRVEYAHRGALGR